MNPSEPGRERWEKEKGEDKQVNKEEIIKRGRAGKRERTVVSLFLLSLCSKLDSQAQELLYNTNCVCVFSSAMISCSRFKKKIKNETPLLCEDNPVSLGFNFS